MRDISHIRHWTLLLLLICATLFAASFFVGCDLTSSDDSEADQENESSEFDPGIDDDYSHISHIDNFSSWGHYNVHDPTLIKHDGYYYMFSTDVFFGGGNVDEDDPRRDPKIPIRRSENLVDWHPIGHVFDEMPEDVIDFMTEIQPDYRPLAVWAPFIKQVGDEFRLYYSVPANDDLQTAYLGLATSPHPEGPWENQGLVLATYDGDEHNGIDPALMVERASGRHWLFHGSWQAGIFVVEVDPETGFRIDDQDKGEIVATRLLSNGSAAMEGAEVLYRPENDMYYMFVTYDWLMEPYNVRVGRAEEPQGPYLDMFGENLANHTDNYPKITAQYRFSGHYGWKGVGHTGLLNDDGDYYLASNGRLGGPFPNEHLMLLHLRRMFWTDDGWPKLSPQRYAGVPQIDIQDEDVIGRWEYISLDETFSKNDPLFITLSSNGSVNNNSNSSWNFDGSHLTLDIEGREPFTAKLFRGWDWENSRTALLFTGLNSDGIAQWGKQIE